MVYILSVNKANKEETTLNFMKKQDFLVAEYVWFSMNGASV